MRCYQIDIVDQNDHSPSFRVVSPDVIYNDGDDDVIVDITEESVIGTRLISVLGRDKDQGINGEIVFEILNDDNGLLSLESSHTGE